jgi:hypothetical protein
MKITLKVTSEQWDVLLACVRRCAEQEWALPTDRKVMDDMDKRASDAQLRPEKSHFDWTKP